MLRMRFFTGALIGLIIAITVPASAATDHAPSCRTVSDRHHFEIRTASGPSSGLEVRMIEVRVKQCTGQAVTYKRTVMRTRWAEPDFVGR